MAQERSMSATLEPPTGNDVPQMLPELTGAARRDAPGPQVVSRGRVQRPGTTAAPQRRRRRQYALWRLGDSNP